MDGPPARAFHRPALPLLLLLVLAVAVVVNLPQLPLPERGVGAAGDLLESHVVDLGAQVEHEKEEDALEQSKDKDGKLPRKTVTTARWGGGEKMEDVAVRSAYFASWKVGTGTNQCCRMMPKRT